MKLLPASLVASLACLVGLASGLASCSENLTPSPERAGYDAGALAPLSCLPNLDGKIDAK
ncbi:MAG: hypothetical protein JWM74_6135, partial [Myxococcaceae bacterium]|nr:hypothetical protein [Myxococcaceae bacterium]